MQLILDPIMPLVEGYAFFQGSLVQLCDWHTADIVAVGAVQLSSLAGLM
jgi:hypothetical protein